jgi:hypothetical protein
MVNISSNKENPEKLKVEVKKITTCKAAEDIKSQRRDSGRSNTTHDVTETISEHSFKTIPKAPKLLFSV